MSSPLQTSLGSKAFFKPIHRRNSYDLWAFNGDIGVNQQIDNEELTCVMSFFPDQRIVVYKRDDIPELGLSYAITLHKSQGSEFGAMIILIVTQHFNSKSTCNGGLNQDISQRQTYLKELL